MPKGHVNDFNESAELIPYRIIPVDIGYKIDFKQRINLVRLLKKHEYKISVDIRLFGENALICVRLNDDLSFYVFGDGIGVFAFEDTHFIYNDVSQLSVDMVLSERKNTHKTLLEHTHRFSFEMDKIVDLLRSVVKTKKRRLTSCNSWENKGLSYVMSFYFLNTNREAIDRIEVQEWLGNMLFTDKHTYFGDINESFEKEKQLQIMTNIDVLNDVHVCHSWATMIVLGKLTKEQRFYYVSLETVLQHIWMFAYITEQNIDMFLAESNKKASSQQLTDFYDTLIDMSLIVKKYDTIINSTVHERELRIFDALKDSSKLEILKRGIDNKSSILESKLSWAVDQKRLKSDRNTEIFIIVLTVLQVLSGFGIGINDISRPYIWPIMLAGLIVLIISRMRD